RPATGRTRLQSPLCLAELVLEGPDPVRQRLGGLRSGRFGGRRERVGARPQVRIRARPGQGLDPAHPGADRALAGDHEAPDLTRGSAMCPAAELVAEAPDADRPDRLAVL